MDPKACLKFVERRETRRQAGLDARFARAQRDARAVVDLIVSNYHPRRVYQWGSILDRRRFWERSDIDIAVEGIEDPETFFRLCGEVDRLAQLPLDLVAIERVEPEFAELIRTRGKIVYER